MIQIDGPRRHVFIRFTNEDRMNAVLQETKGQLEFRHDNGEISQVLTEIAGMGTKKIRIANLSPDVKENEIRASMSKYGEVKSTRDEMWTSAYKYKVYNAICIVEMKFKLHLPSHISIAGNDAQISMTGSLRLIIDAMRQDTSS